MQGCQEQIAVIDSHVYYVQIRHAAKDVPLEEHWQFGQGYLDFSYCCQQLHFEKHTLTVTWHRYHSLYTGLVYMKLISQRLTWLTRETEDPLIYVSKAMIMRWFCKLIVVFQFKFSQSWWPLSLFSSTLSFPPLLILQGTCLSMSVSTQIVLPELQCPPLSAKQWTLTHFNGLTVTCVECLSAGKCEDSCEFMY